MSSFDHTGVTSGCQAAGCHNEGSTNAKSVSDDQNPPTKTHIPIMNGATEADCYNCHKNPGGTFANATMDHSVVTFEGCESCHDGKHDGANTAHVATAQPTGHFAPSSSTTYKTVSAITTCASCHTSTSDWTQLKYTHRKSSANPPGYYPGDHSTRRVTMCSQCHNDNPPTYQIKLFDTTPYYPYCVACHVNDSGHGIPPNSSHYDCGKSGCHKVSSSSFG